MQQAIGQEPAGYKRRRRPGLKRVMIHIIVFGIIGVLFLGLGIFGLKTLENRTIVQKTTVRIETLFDASVKEMQAMLQDLTKSLAAT